MTHLSEVYWVIAGFQIYVCCVRQVSIEFVTILMTLLMYLVELQICRTFPYALFAVRVIITLRNLWWKSTRFVLPNQPGTNMTSPDSSLLSGPSIQVAVRVGFLLMRGKRQWSQFWTMTPFFVLKIFNQLLLGSKWGISSMTDAGWLQSIVQAYLLIAPKLSSFIWVWDPRAQPSYLFYCLRAYSPYFFDVLDRNSKIVNQLFGVFDPVRPSQVDTRIALFQ